MVHAWKLSNGYRMDYAAPALVATIRCESCGVRVEPRLGVVTFMDVGSDADATQMTLVLCNQCFVNSKERLEAEGGRPWPI